MTQTTPATARLTVAEAYKRHIQTVRRNAAIERQRVEVQGDISRVQALYTEGSLKRQQAAPAPTYKEAATYVTTKLPGGAKASIAAEKAAVTRRKRVLDESPEAVAKREKRRARRAARKLRQAAAQG